MEEELGIDADMKEVLGMQDTDSEESDSDSDSGASSDGGFGSDDEGSVEEDIEDAEEGAGSESDIGEVEEAEEEDDDPFISVASALEDPIYVVSIQPEVKSCIVCPGKLLKNPEMTKTHTTSNACGAH